MNAAHSDEQAERQKQADEDAYLRDANDCKKWTATLNECCCREG